MARIGDVEFNVLSESRPHDNEVTTHPVEDGVDITDHVRKQPKVYSIEGHVGDNEDPGAKHLALSYLWARGDLVDYSGRTKMKNVIVENFTSDVDESTQKGFTFSLTLREIDIAKPSTVSLLPVSLKVDVAEVGNAGRVQAQ